MEIEYLSNPERVNMGDHYFEMATPEHFWIRRRFNVFKKLFDTTLLKKLSVGEIGCGSGVLLRQLEDTFSVIADGFDLNEFALKNAISKKSKLYCYNISDKNPAFKEKYDLILLFDVLEHIHNHNTFIENVLFHIKKGGTLVVNVPASQKLFSKYDIAAGHVKRYEPKDLMDIEKKHNLSTKNWSYWGLPLLPLAIFRKILLNKKSNNDEVLQFGFGKRNNVVNTALTFFSNIEVIPQQVFGTSIMWVYTKEG